jgi:uncharacterized protein (DUF58 family)
MLGSGQVSSTYPNLTKSPRPVGRQWQSPPLEVWLRFLLALLGLALAFGAALFSTVCRDAGNVLATVILASLSLLLAAFVGLVTVPYLARRVALERLRDTFDYEVTRVGVVYVLVTLVIGIAALNTGNNLLYIVVAAMLSAILASGMASAVVLRSLELDVRMPAHLFAGRAAQGRITLRNSRRWLPSFSIGVIASRKKDKKGKKPAMQWEWEAVTFAFPLNRPPEKQWLKLPDRRLRRVAMALRTPAIFPGTVYFPFLPPAAEVSAEIELKFDRRGRYREDSFGLVTAFPFAFLTKTRRVPLQREIVVYPRVERTDQLFEILPQLRGEWEGFVRGRGSDLHLIREYGPDDSARHVDWKATAKSGSLKVREFTREDERRLRIVFDNPEAGTISEQAYEQAVELTASLGWHFAEQNAEVSFLIAGHDGSDDVHEFLAQLAVVEPWRTTSAGERSSALWGDPGLAKSLNGSGVYNIILTAKSRESLPGELQDSSSFVFLQAEK